MFKIAICDPLPSHRSMNKAALCQIYKKLDENFEITEFSSGEQLCESLKNNSYDIILLDVLIKGMNGLETANRIRSMGDSLIVFISYEDRCVTELIGLHTIGFLFKPIVVDELEIVVKTAHEIINENNERKGCVDDGYFYDALRTEIINFQACFNRVIINTTREQIKIPGSLKHVWLKVKKHENFVMTNKSCIFNLDYVFLERTVVVLRPNVLLPKATKHILKIGRRYKNDAYNRLIKYVERGAV